MKAKLIKEGSFGYKIKFYNDDDMAACALGLLSLKNCQAIERGYDLDELAKKFRNETIMNSSFISDETSFKEGAKAIIELLGDKKYTEEDLDRAVSQGIVKGRLGIDTFFQSLQKTEWDVEIEMEDLMTFASMPKEGENRVYQQPKLDADGCLILKRK
jgi:hypothetical protein